MDPQQQNFVNQSINLMWGQSKDSCHQNATYNLNQVNFLLYIYLSNNVEPVPLSIERLSLRFWIWFFFQWATNVPFLKLGQHDQTSTLHQQFSPPGSELTAIYKSNYCRWNTIKKTVAIVQSGMNKCMHQILKCASVQETLNHS